MLIRDTKPKNGEGLKANLLKQLGLLEQINKATG